MKLTELNYAQAKGAQYCNRHEGKNYRRISQFVSLNRNL